MPDVRFWRIRHKPTGKFFTPVQGSYGSKTNLNKSGRVYHRKPGFGKVQGKIYMGIYDEGKSWKPKLIETVPTDWEIIEYSLKEEKVTQHG